MSTSAALARSEPAGVIATVCAPYCRATSTASTTERAKPETEKAITVVSCVVTAAYMRCNCPSTCVLTGIPSRNKRFCISVASMDEMPPDPRHSTGPPAASRSATFINTPMSSPSLARWIAATAASVTAVAMRLSRTSRAGISEIAALEA